MSDNPERIERLTEASAQTRVHDQYTNMGVGIPALSLFPFFRPKSDLDIPRWGFAGRDAMLDRVWHVAGADIVASAIAVIIQKVQSTGYTIEGPERTVSGRARPIIDFAEYGRGFIQFTAKWVTAFTTHDNGVFTELIADAPDKAFGGITARYQDNDPVPNLMIPRDTPILGVAVLDSTRCERTGDFEYPVRYYDLQGRAHLYHRSRIHFISDMPSNQEWMFDYGFCALSRCLATLHYGVNWATARNEMLDNMPPLSIATASGINKKDLETQMKEFNQQREAMGEYILRTVLMLVNANADKEVKFDLTNIRQLWESFDEKQALDVSVTMVAMAFGLDYQDLAPLSTSSMGSGMQSSILDQKTIGKGSGNILRHLEALLKEVLPGSCQFKFDYKDDEADLKRAQIIQTKSATILSLTQPVPSTSPQPTESPLLTSLPSSNSEGILNRDEARKILMAEVPEWADIIDPDRIERDEVVVDELSPELESMQQKMFGERIKYYSSGKIVKLTKKRRGVSVPAISAHEVQDALRDLSDMGIDMQAIRDRQYAAS